MLPLTGITVVALEQAVAAPLATRHLADLGARVIKIERPDGGDFARSYDTTVRGLSSHFVWLNRSKESVALDLKDARSREIMARLVERADVFVQNLAPGAAERLGLEASALHARHPRLIVCNISGYGPDGPFAARKAYDLLIQSEVGLLSITGTPEAPSKAGISIADIAAGMYGFSGILAALYRRAGDGRGSVIDVSLFDALAEWMGYPLYYTLYGGAAPARTGARHASIAPYGPFLSRDGVPCYVAVQNDREWRRFCDEVLERKALADDGRFSSNARRVAHHDELCTEIDAVFSTHTASELTSRLERAGIANARLNTVESFAEHEQLRARSRWSEVESPVGLLRTLVPPISLDGERGRLDPVPALGEHTDAILAELGFTNGRTGKSVD
jgi:crotonobetainyl-CoA:carnitine CoA-transferase CaiB-like acyl-CoA transferase